jgi:hypothetical protein
MLNKIASNYLDKVAKEFGWKAPEIVVPKELSVKNVPYTFNFTLKPRQNWMDRQLATRPVKLGNFPNADKMRKSYGIPIEAWQMYNEHLKHMVPMIRNGKRVIDEAGKPKLIEQARQLNSKSILNVPQMPSDWEPSPTFKRLPDGVIWAQGRRESDGGIKNNNKASRGMFQPELPIFKRLVKRFPDQMKGITWEGLSNNVEHAHKVRDLTDLLNAKDFNNRYGRLPTIKETLMMYKEGLNVFNQPKNSETYQRGRQYVNNIVKDLFYHNPTYAKKVFPELVNYKDIPLVPLKAIPKTTLSVNVKNPSNVYTVQSGDILSRIVAARGIKGATNIYNMVNKIKKINNLKNDNIKPGQTLILPDGF